MSIEVIQDAGVMQTLPSAAAGASVSLATGSWANSAYAEIVASAADDYILMAVCMQGTTANLLRLIEVDIAVGAAASEVVIATVTAAQGFYAYSRGYIPLSIPIDAIPAGSRVSARVRKHDTGVGVTMRVSIVVLSKPVGRDITTTTNPSLSYPSAATGTSVSTNTSLWANTAWTEIVASTSDAIVLAGVVMVPPAFGSQNWQWEFDIGVGGAGSESVVTTVRGGTQLSYPSLFPLRPVLDNIPAGSRISFRVRGNDTTSRVMYCRLLYYNKTGLGDVSNVSTTLPMKWFPAASNALNLPQSATNWVNGAYVEFSASLPAAIQIAAMTLGTVVGLDREIDFAIGAASSEVVVDTVRASHSTGTLYGSASWHNFPYLLSNYPAGSRLALRTRGEGLSTSGVNVAIGYYEGATTPLAESPTMTFPTGASNIAVTPNGTAWASSTWNELISAMPQTGQIGYLTFWNPIGDAECEVDIGVGDAGSEVVQATLRVAIGGTASGDLCRALYLPIPLHITVGQRVAIRMRKSGTSTSFWSFGAMVYTEILPDEPEFDPVDDIAGNTIGLVWVEFALEEGA